MYFLTQSAFPKTSFSNGRLTLGSLGGWLNWLGSAEISLGRSGGDESLIVSSVSREG